jgi:hypothetical protein
MRFKKIFKYSVCVWTIFFSLASYSILPALALAPTLTIGILEGSALGLGALLAAGTIQKNEANRYQQQIQQTTTPDVYEDQKSQSSFMDSLKKMFSLNSRNSTCSESQKEINSVEGDCPPEKRGDPFACCSEFMNKFIKKEPRLIPKGKYAYKVSYIGRNSITHDCCLEWDSMHGRFEVFQSSNHEAFRHKGERSCAKSENLSDNICEPTHPEKMDLSGRHAPRHGCP